MFRNVLLAGAAALALLPAVGSAQTSAADAAQQTPSQVSGVAAPGGSTTPYSSPVPGSADQASSPPDASSTNDSGPVVSSPQDQTPDQSQPANPAPGYYSSSPSDQTAPPNAGANGMDMNRSGSAYTAQPQAGEQPPPPPPPPGATAQPEATAPGYAENTQTNANQQVVVVPKQNISSREYVRRAAMADRYEILAARVALRRAQSDTTRQFANDMLQQHSQSTAILTQAADQAGVPVNPRLDRYHRAMLRRLVRAPAGSFDHVYMHQQLVAHMGASALHQGYAQNGDNPTLRQAAQQISPIVQQHLDLAWNDSGMADRMAEQRNNELSQLAENNRGQTYRGYTVIGPTSVRQLKRRQREREQNNTTGSPGGGLSSNSGASGAVGTPQYQGYSSSQISPSSYDVAQATGGGAGTGAGTGTGAGAAAPPGTATPGSPGATTVPGTPQSQGGYTTTQPSTGAASPGSTTGTSPPPVGTPRYQGYTSGTPGSAAPGNTTTPGTTTPGNVTPGTTSPGVTPGGNVPGTPPQGTTATPNGSTPPYGPG